MRVYIIGPITNNPNYRQEFEQAEKKLKAEGHEVINPAALNGVIQFEATHDEYMKICLPLLDLADAVYMIDGWRGSTGACIECGYALAKDKIIIQRKEITDKIIAKLERVFGFYLFDWQKAYLKGDDSAFPSGGRRNGKTFTYCVRLLLEDRPSIDLSSYKDVSKLVDEYHGNRYPDWFRGYLREINNQLLAGGFDTNGKTNIKPLPGERERNAKMKSGWIINLKSGARIMLDEKAYEKYRNEPPKEEVKSEEHWFNIDNMCKANLNLDLMEL